MSAFIDLFARVADLERRIEGMFRKGTVDQVDPAKQMIRMKIGGTDTEPMLSPWIPYAQVAGALKLHSPPSVGQQMVALSPSGDFVQAVAMPYTWSDANASPSSVGTDHVLTLGNVRLELRDGNLKLKIGETEVDVTGGEVTIKSASIKTEGTTITHNDKNIGHDHRHTDVMPGGALTGPPQ